MKQSTSVMNRTRLCAFFLCVVIILSSPLWATNVWDIKPISHSPTGEAYVEDAYARKIGEHSWEIGAAASRIQLGFFMTGIQITGYQNCLSGNGVECIDARPGYAGRKWACRTDIPYCVSVNCQLSYFRVFV